MSRCLFCGEELDNNSLNGWHEKCIIKFFGSLKVFNDINYLDIEKATNDIVKDGTLVPGVQKKLSKSYEFCSHKSIINGFYIFKFNSIELEEIAESEHLVMTMANKFKIQTALHGLVRIKDEYVYVCKRFDRKNNNTIHVEDFCQLSNKLAAFKYESSCERLFKIIEKYSSSPILDKVLLFERIIFSYITLNSDMHLKNYSLIEDKTVRLSPAYDLIPVNLIYKLDKEESALTINEKKQHIKRNDFIKLGRNASISDKVINNIIDKLTNINIYNECIDNSFLSLDKKLEFKTLINERIQNLIK